jgi:hypothetical protein
LLDTFFKFVEETYGQWKGRTDSVVSSIDYAFGMITAKPSSLPLLFCTTYAPSATTWRASTLTDQMALHLDFQLLFCQHTTPNIF